MLTGDYLARRLIRLKPSEAWNNAGSGLIFLLTKSGSGRYLSSCRKLSHDLKPGDVAVLNPRVNGQVSVTGAGQLTFYCFTAPIEHLMSLFTASEVCMLQGLMSLFDTSRHYPASTSLARECHKLIELAPEDLSFRHRCHLLEVVSAIFSAEMSQVRMDHTGNGDADKHFSQVLGGLTAADIMSVPVQDLAARFGWSRRHLSRIFLQHFGTSLAELKMELRLLKAADLLLNPDLKVINVADQCGFNHLGLFNTCFKRRLGASPGQWRKLAPRSQVPGHRPHERQQRIHAHREDHPRHRLATLNPSQREDRTGPGHPTRTAHPISRVKTDGPHRMNLDYQLQPGKRSRDEPRNTRNTRKQSGATTFASHESHHPAGEHAVMANLFSFCVFRVFRGFNCGSSVQPRTLRTPLLTCVGRCLALTLLLAAPLLFAQEALRNLSTPEPPGPRENPDKYTFKTGDFLLLVTPSLGTEWNDNVYTSRNNEESDLIFRPSLLLDASYPFTAHNLLSLNVGLGYDYYLDHDDLSTWHIAGSALAFDIFVQDYWINLHDRFSYVQDSSQQAAVANTADYATFNNMAGLLVTRQMNDITASIGYDHETVLSDASQYSSEDHGSELFTGRAGFRVHPEMTTGFEVTGSFTRYEEPVLNDNSGFSVGPYVEFQPGNHFQATLRGGYSTYYFENTSQSVVTEDVNSWYLGLTLTHDITDAVSYNVDLGRDVRLGIDSDLIQSFHVRPGVNWRATDVVTVRSTFSYEHGEQGIGNLAGNYQEEYDWLSWGVGMSYHLMTRLAASLDYRLTLRSSDDPSREYTQNTITLNLNYQVP